MFRVLIMLLLLVSALARAQDCAWPAWAGFRQEQISTDGRVIDYSTDARISTSEGQAYALFFALVADDRTSFERLLKWTANNLTPGGLEQALPAWSWGRNADGRWTVLDANNASDADLWLAYSLLEAGRIWHEPDYARLGTELLWRSAAGSVRKLPGLGLMLLPADHGFEHAGRWRLNPSYLPLQLLERFAGEAAIWREVADNSRVLLKKSAPAGFAPDWVGWTGQGVNFAESGSKGSYDAIRVYLWLGMLPADYPRRDELLAHFRPLAELYLQNGRVPEAIDVQTAEATGEGADGFVAALLPWLQADRELTGTTALLEQGRIRLQQPVAKTAYYDRVLSLFADGWLRGLYSFDKNGLLQRARETGVCR